MNIGIIGYGYWGPNLVRNFMMTNHCTVRMVADARQERLSVLKNNYSNILVTDKSETILDNEDIDAVVIATPVFTHFQLAQKALQNGKHVLIEKPMTHTSAQALELIDLAAKKIKY